MPKQFLDSAIEILAKHKNPKIPDSEALMPGDIILTSNREDYQSSPVYMKQLNDGHVEKHAKWTHAMLYVGHLHAAESTTEHRDLSTGKKEDRTGTRFVPLTEYSADHNMIVCRPPKLGFPYRNRLEAVNYAMLDVAVRPRKYDFVTVFNEVATEVLAEEAAEELRVRANPQKEVLCTHFVMECLAAAGGILVAEYVSALRTNRLFYPADLAKHVRFEADDVPMFDVIGVPSDLKASAESSDKWSFLLPKK